MPYWENIKLALKPEKYGFEYQAKYDLYYRNDFFLRCKKSKINSELVHIWELERRINKAKIKIKDSDMKLLLDNDMYLNNILIKDLF